MRIVPENRILIQPTVQLKWIEQHQRIEFLLSQAQQLVFQQIWKRFKQSNFASAFEFLNSDLAVDLELFNADLNFALLVGADFIQQRHPGFTMQYLQPNLVWSIAVLPDTKAPGSPV